MGEFGLNERVVLVAGAGGGGIGTAVCRRLADAGAHVVALDVDAARLQIAETALSEIGVPHRSLVVDVRDGAAVADAVAAAAELGPVHGLVHVAGGMRPDQWAPLLAADDAAFDTVVELNFRSAVTTSKAVGAHLARGGGGGSIVFIASIVGMTAMPYGAAYAAAKAAVLAIMRTAAIEWGPLGIRVNAVAPGTIRTPKNDADRRADDKGNRTSESIVVPLGRRGTPDDIAAAVLFLQSDLAAYVTGQVITVDGGSSIRPGYLDADGLPVFVRDEALRARLTSLA